MTSSSRECDGSGVFAPPYDAIYACPGCRRCRPCVKCAGAGDIPSFTLSGRGPGMVPSSEFTGRSRCAICNGTGTAAKVCEACGNFGMVCIKVGSGGSYWERCDKCDSYSRVPLRAIEWSKETGDLLHRASSLLTRWRNYAMAVDPQLNGPDAEIFTRSGMLVYDINRTIGGTAAQPAEAKRTFVAGVGRPSDNALPEQPAGTAAEGGDARYERTAHALMEMMRAYERRIRSDCRTQEEIDKRPWECREYLYAADVLKKGWASYNNDSSGGSKP